MAEQRLECRATPFARWVDASSSLPPRVIRVNKELDHFRLQLVGVAIVFSHVRESMAADGRGRSRRLMRVSSMVHAVDAHACGEPGRVIVGGVLDVPGATMYDKMCYLRDHGDGLRKRMLREPRGYPAANCNLILPSSHPDADAGFVIMEQVEYPGMSGTNTICVTTVLLETGMLPMREPVTELTLESAGGSHSRPRRLRQRQGEARHVSQRPRVRGVSRHADRSASSRNCDGRRGVRRHVLRHRRRDAVRTSVSRRTRAATSCASVR